MYATRFRLLRTRALPPRPGVATPDPGQPPLSHAVSLRRREVGLRLALGAERRDIVRSIVGQALRVVAAASVGGLLVSMALCRLLDGMLFGVSSHDPSTFGAVVVIVLGGGACAALLPALRVSRVDPDPAARSRSPPDSTVAVTNTMTFRARSFLPYGYFVRTTCVTWSVEACSVHV